MDIDENSLDSTAEQHQLLKAVHSPMQMPSLKLANGSFGVEVKDINHKDETPRKQDDSGEEAEEVKKEEQKTQLLDVSCDQTHLNGIDEDLPLTELSPSLRRSTRASALKAQEKIRHKDGVATTMVDSHVAENGPIPATPANEITAQTTAADADQQLESPVKKKQKLSVADNLDQFDCKFGIRLDADGDVVMMTDGSEISSLNEEEAIVVRQKYDEIKSREDSEMSFEKTKEREFQVRGLESAIRLEEAKLSMLKKIRANQQLTARNAMQENARRLASNITQNTTGNAYKPTIAQQQNAAKLNGNVNMANAKIKNKTTRPSMSPAGNFQLTPQHQQLIQRLMEQGALRPEQLATILHSLNPAALATLSQTSSKNQREQQEREQRLREQQEKERKLRQEQEAQQKANAEAAEAARQARENAQNTQQRIANARAQLRRHLEQQLLQLPAPKVPVPELSFIPNATQPDFLYLLGLDLVVQRNLKDKTVFKKVDFEPYTCEECGTDFTPNWKAISGDKDDLHLYCEQCVRQAQKRKVRHERTILYKKAFQKIAEQEKEFERKVSSGKFNDTSNALSSSKDAFGKDASTSAQNNLSSKASNFNAAALSGLASSAKAFGHPASSLASNSNLANRSLQNNFGARNQVKQEPPKKPLPNTTASRKRSAPTSSSSNSANNMSSTFATLMANNPGMLNMLQQMSNMPAAMRNSINPMFASIMTNPQMMTQLYAHMIQQQQQQRANTSSSNNSNPVSAILQAIAQSQGNRSNSTTSISSSSNHTSQHQPLSQQQSSGGGSSSVSSTLLSQMTPALLQHLVAAAAQSRKK